jgi:chromosome partitioning protein
MVPPFLLGAVSPTWTDKEVLIAVGSVAGAIVSASLGVMRLVTMAARRRNRTLSRENQELRDRVASIPVLEAKLQQAEKEADSLKQGIAEASSREATRAQEVERLQAALESSHATVDEHADVLAAERRRIEKAASKDGQTWTERVLAGAPEFKPLDPDVRRMPIVSVLNLKGGVGKTTITANLGAAMAARGFRTLLLDLDLQGSLTGLFIPEGEQASLQREHRMLGDFLASSFDADSPKLPDYTQPILQDGCALVPTADELTYAELNLTIRWLLRDSRRDPRFLLRKELHLKRVTNNFDVVLLDCPPLINVSCVNALAASDYVLIPILPSKQATARVPVLLERLKEFRDNINPSLKVMGIVCNRTLRSELTADEENRLTRLRGQCVDVWGEEVRQLDTFIRQSREVRTAEDERRPLGQGDEMREVFGALADEVVGRLPMFCRASTRATRNEEALS